MKDLLGREEAVEVSEAVSILLGQELKEPDTEVLAIEDLNRRVLAEDIIAPEDLPGFCRSTMDGYAVKAEDTFGAAGSAPVYLNISGSVNMGEKPEFIVKRGKASLIPTGGMLPEGADAVVMFEYTSRVDDNIVEIMKAVAPGENTVAADEDVRKGELVFEAGHRIRPQDAGALAGLGIVRVNVYKMPVVAVIGTGDEIVQAGRQVGPGTVRDINSYNLAGLISECGAVPLKKGIVRDEIDQLRRVLSEALDEADMVLITGGSSVGTRDYTSAIINEMGNPGILFHGVTIKPGKPLIGGMASGVPIFGLPGHPAAITVCFETFVEPVLSVLTGERVREFMRSRRTVRALFSRNISSSAGREEHVRVRVQRRNGALWAVPIMGKSALIRTLVNADGTVIVPMNKSGVYEGEEVEVRLFR